MFIIHKKNLKVNKGQTKIQTFCDYNVVCQSGIGYNKSVFFLIHVGQKKYSMDNKCPINYRGITW